MKLYNSLSKNIEDFKPLKDNEISIYSCGPTVYDRAHIGNMASYIYADNLRRALAIEFPGAKIKHVMNITDVDDKTIRRSQEENPDLEPMAALNKLTSHYEELFMQDLELVGVDLKSITFVRATDYIEQMQNLIRKLVASGVGYVTGDGVYFSIAKYKAAGHIYGQLVDINSENTGEARIDNDEYDKDSVHDFALWKKQKPGEPAWDFEIEGTNIAGRPGWHIECSAMSVGELGQPFDIHTGGVDLKFPHHENEIAQSIGASPESSLATYFVHNEHILVDGKKMSKSLNNFYTLDDIEKKAINPLAFRLLVMQAHYRSQAHFSWENLEAAANRLKSYIALASLVWQAIDRVPSKNKSFTNLLQSIKSSLASDLNMAKALSALSTFSDSQNAVLPSKDYLADFQELLKSLDSVLGLDLSKSPDITDQQKDLVKKRENMRKAKDFEKSDEFRRKLKEQGIGLNDTEEGSIWYRL